MIYACFPNAVTDDKCFVDSNWLVNMDNKLYCSPLAITTGQVEVIIDGDTDKVIGSRFGSGGLTKRRLPGELENSKSLV